MKVNKRLYKLSKCTSKEQYIAHLEFACELLRLQVRHNGEKIDEMNAQIEKQEFMILPDSEYKRGWDECVQHCIRE